MNQADYFKCRHPGSQLLGVELKAIEERTTISTLTFSYPHRHHSILLLLPVFPGQKNCQSRLAYWLSSKCYVLPAH